MFIVESPVLLGPEKAPHYGLREKKSSEIKKTSCYYTIDAFF